MSAALKVGNFWKDIRSSLNDPVAAALGKKLQLLQEPRRSLCEYEIFGVLSRHMSEQQGEIIVVETVNCSDE